MALRKNLLYYSNEKLISQILTVLRKQDFCFNQRCFLIFGQNLYKIKLFI